MKLTDLSSEEAETGAGKVIERWINDHGAFDAPVHVYLGGVAGEPGRLVPKLGWGRLWSAARPNPMEGEDWALDNGAWADWASDKPFDGERFLRFVEHGRKTGIPPKMAVVPDKVQGGRRSLHYSLEWLLRLEREGHREAWPWYLAVQPGMDLHEVEGYLVNFDGIFLGGGQRMKFEARRWANMAKNYELPFHYAQCGTAAKIAHAFDLGAESLDTTNPVYTTTDFQHFLSTFAMISESYESV